MPKLSGGVWDWDRGRKPEIFTYNRLADLKSDALQVPERWHNCGHDSNGLSYEACCDLLPVGDDSQVPSAEKALEKFMVNSMQVRMPMWEQAMAGAFPCVPEFLAGEPECMRTLVQTVSDTAPITIWVDLGSSAGVTNRELENRGIAVLALVLKLRQIRPVKLNICYGAPSNGVGIVMPWQTTPIELATSCATLCRGELTRLPIMAILRNASQDWIGALLQDDEEMRGFFNIPAGDLILKSTIVFDKARTDPIGWINDQLQKLGVEEA